MPCGKIEGAFAKSKIRFVHKVELFQSRSKQALYLRIDTVQIKAMKKLALISVFLFKAFIAAAQPPELSQEEEDLRYTFYNYQAAVNALDVEKAASYLDSNTLKFYDTVLAKVKYAEEDVLLQTDFTSWYIVMFTRFMAPDGAISQMKSGKDVLLFMMKNSLRGQLFGLEVLDISVYGTNAIVYVSKDGELQDTQFNFVQYGDADWRLDYTKQFSNSNRGLEIALENDEIMAAYKFDKKEFLNAMIRNKGWNKGGRDLWKVRQ